MKLRDREHVLHSSMSASPYLGDNASNGLYCEIQLTHLARNVDQVLSHMLPLPLLFTFPNVQGHLTYPADLAEKRDS